MSTGGFEHAEWSPCTERSERSSLAYLCQVEGQSLAIFFVRHKCGHMELVCLLIHFIPFKFPFLIATLASWIPGLTIVSHKLSYPIFGCPYLCSTFVQSRVRTWELGLVSKD